jgi:hypothetical protein
MIIKATIDRFNKVKKELNVVDSFTPIASIPVKDGKNKKLNKEVQSGKFFIPLLSSL